MKAAPKAVEIWDTGVDANMLKLVGKASVAVPEDFVSKTLRNAPSDDIKISVFERK